MSSGSASSGPESDVSDASGSIEQRTSPTQLRVTALDCLHSLAEVRNLRPPRLIAQSHSSPLHAHWSLLLPSNAAQRRTLLDLIEFDRDTLVRLRACSVLVTMVASSRQFLSIADDACVPCLLDRADRPGPQRHRSPPSRPSSATFCANCTSACAVRSQRRQALTSQARSSLCAGATRVGTHRSGLADPRHRVAVREALCRASGRRLAGVGCGAA